ncbi:F0F1 ATP synthase subunit B [Patescibacteria group bacterium]|nr:F0F1 ATP synthase subunit B [Patescibacteria group bacterium]
MQSDNENINVDQGNIVLDEAGIILEGEVHEEVSVESGNPIEAVAGQFGLNGQIFVAQLINFTIVLVVLWIFAYKPIIKMLDERKEKIEKSIKQADDIERRITAIEDEKKEVIAAAKKEAQKIAEEAQKIGEDRRAEIVESAKREVERVISKGKQQLSEEREAMLRDVRKDVVDIAMKATARILSGQIDEKKSQSLAEEIVRKMT